MSYNTLLCINFNQLEELNRVTGDFSQSLLYGRLKHQINHSKLTEDGKPTGKPYIARSRSQIAELNGKGLTCTDEDLEELKSRNLIDCCAGLWNGKKRMRISCNKDYELGLNTRKLELMTKYTGGNKQSVMLAYFAYWTEKMPLTRKDGLWCMVPRNKVAELIGVESKTKTVDVFMKALVEKGIIKYEVRRLFRQRQFKVKINDDFYNKIVAELNEIEIAFNLSKQAKTGVSIKVNNDPKVDIINNNIRQDAEANSNPQVKQGGTIILSKKEQNYLWGAVKNTLPRCKGVKWELKSLMSQLRYVLSSPEQRKGTTSFAHAVNRAMFLIREGLWKQPFGYEKYNEDGKAEYDAIRAQEKAHYEQKDHRALSRLAVAGHVPDELDIDIPLVKGPENYGKRPEDDEDAERARKMADLEHRWLQWKYGAQNY